MTSTHPGIRTDAILGDDEGIVIRTTRGICPTCLGTVRAAVVRDLFEVRLEKYCDEHGTSSRRLSRNPRDHADLDQFFFRVNGGSHRQQRFLLQAAVPRVHPGPVCLRVGVGEVAVPVAGIEAALAKRRGVTITLVATPGLAGADLVALARKVVASGNRLALKTEGMELLDDAVEAALLPMVSQLTLCLDGFDERAPSGSDRAARLAVLERLRVRGMPTSLTVLIEGGSGEQVVQAFRFALRPENRFVRQVVFAGRSREVADTTGLDPAEIADLEPMNDELVEALAAAEPSIELEDVRSFTKLYYALTSSMHVRRCAYLHHYLVHVNNDGSFEPIAGRLDLEALEAAAERYADRFGRGSPFASMRLAAEIARIARRSGHREEMIALRRYLKIGGGLGNIPRRILPLGFIVPCDGGAYDEAVSRQCGYGEVSIARGFRPSATAENALRESLIAGGEIV